MEKTVRKPAKEWNFPPLKSLKYNLPPEDKEITSNFSESSPMHQRLSLWREDGVLENIEADQSYFLAGVHHITKRKFDKQLANIAPCASPDIVYGDLDNAFSSMKLDENGFMWEMEVVEEDVHRTRASAFDKVTETRSSVFPKKPGEETIPPTGWDDIDE